MDIFLLFILTGLALALVKRASSNWFGLKKTTKHAFFDRVAITTLWLIFPLRLLAESLTATHHHHGSFLTNNLGEFLGSFLPAQLLYYPAWWAYSLALGGFFISLPFSRFMHIPTEVMLIFLRHYGIKPALHFNSYSNFEIQSCPKCGVCIDACPVHTDANQDGIPPAYFLRSLKMEKPDLRSTYNCLLCGKCKEYCPVGININALRVSQRIRYAKNLSGSFTYLKPAVSPVADVAYFAGCMTHLTPSIKISMEKIFTAADIKYQFIDRDGSVCCGRPLLMAGKEDQARELMKHNKKLIESSNCKTLVLSCPICLKIFREEYGFKMEILHHSQYILRLVEEKKINLKKEDLQVAFHDPCELGRGSGIYEEPRELIRKMADIVTAGEEKEMSICCGGSLGSTGINCYQRDSVSQLTVDTLMVNNPGTIITACPLCKKTLQKGSPVEVQDISELASSLLIELPSTKVEGHKKVSIPELQYQEEK
jgi:Fe-S oxidoreductase